MATFNRITSDPDVMEGKPCIRGMRITVGTVLRLLAARHSEEEILKAYPYLEPEDIQAALEYASRCVEEIRIPVTPKSEESLQSPHRERGSDFCPTSKKKYGRKPHPINSAAGLAAKRRMRSSVTGRMVSDRHHLKGVTFSCPSCSIRSYVKKV